MEARPVNPTSSNGGPRSLAGVALAAALSSLPAAAAPPEPLRIRPLGYANATSVIAGMNPAGQVIGRTGSAGWLFDGAALVPVGTYGDRDDVAQASSPFFLNANGQAAGRTTRASDVAGLGETGWVFSGGVTTPVGLFDAPLHVRPDGYSRSHVDAFNAAGQAAGTSDSFLDGQPAGVDAWLYTNGATVPIGLTDAAHTAANGTHFSTVNALNDAGQVVGTSGRHLAGQYAGSSAWIYTAGQITTIGLTDAEHTYAANGIQSNTGTKINALGHVAGQADRAGAPSGLGESAWFYDGTQTRKIGLTDPQHTRADGYRVSRVDLLAQSGDAMAGYSLRYDGSRTAGQSAWRSDGVTTTRIGLAGGSHTNSAGDESSRASFINDAGQIAGTSKRYSGFGESGSSAWLYTGGATREIISGSVAVTGMNARGQVIGTADRKSGSASVGYAGWFYDPAADQVTSLVFSLSAPQLPGPYIYSWTEPFAINDDGTVVGRYIDYTDHRYGISYHAFSWSLAAGFADLGALTDGGLRENGWDVLRDASWISANGHIAGYGFSRNGGPDAYILTAVPEPVALTLLLMPLTAIALRRRPRKAARSHLSRA